MHQNENVRLIMQPQAVPLGRDDFIARTAPYAIALDGYVETGPWFQNRREGGPRANFNHHQEVDRLATRATCAQVLMSVRMGLFKTFRENGKPRADVYANDCDQDVCLSTFILRHSWMSDQAMNPMLNMLVDIEDKLDTTAGAYPFPKDLPLLRKVAWVFRPYADFRVTGLQFRVADQFESVVTSVEDRIMRFVTGSSEEVELDMGYQVVGGNGMWKMVEESGAQARTGMLADGIDAFVSVRKRDDGRYTYTLGRMSLFVPFDVEMLLEELNRAEGCTEDRWGGGNTIGGSPRSSGSILTPDQVEKVISESLAAAG